VPLKLHPRNPTTFKEVGRTRDVKSQAQGVDEGRASTSGRGITRLSERTAKGSEERMREIRWWGVTVGVRKVGNGGGVVEVGPASADVRHTFSSSPPTSLGPVGGDEENVCLTSVEAGQTQF
jgi:hypothetical protein